MKKMTEKEFWKPIIYSHEKLSEHKVMAELSDYHFILQEVPKVYVAISRGKLSKPNYYAKTLIDELEENFYDKEITNDDIAEILKSCETIEELKSEIKSYFTIV